MQIIKQFFINSFKINVVLGNRDSLEIVNSSLNNVFDTPNQGGYIYIYLAPNSFRC